MFRQEADALVARAKRHGLRPVVSGSDREPQGWIVILESLKGCAGGCWYHVSAELVERKIDMLIR